MQADLPEGLQAYSESPVFTEATLPESLQRSHRLKAGTWGKLLILAGTLDYIELEGAGERLSLTAGDSLAIPPQVAHRVETRGALSCRIVFHRAPETAGAGEA